MIAHEVGHALGVIHEHQRNDRDEYVRILTENAYDSFTHLFAVYDAGVTTNLDVAYDYASVMQYHGRVRTMAYKVLKALAKWIITHMHMTLHERLGVMMILCLLQAYSANDRNTLETLDGRYQRTIGQRVELSFLDSYIVNLAYCSGTH